MSFSVDYAKQSFPEENPGNEENICALSSYLTIYILRSMYTLTAAQHFKWNLITVQVSLERPQLFP